MTEALSREDAEDERTIEDIVADYQAARGPQPNISFFAFTATPRNVTLERFGRKGAELPRHIETHSATKYAEN